MSGVNRYLKDKPMDHIDHALGRPVDPMGETYRNHFYICGDTELSRYFHSSQHWRCYRQYDDGAYFEVTDKGRKALKAYLAEIGDKHRNYIVSYGGYEMPVIAVTRAKARYSKWLDISDCDDSLTFSKFARGSKVRLA